METITTTEIQDATSRYINSIFSIDCDLSFWKPFLSRAVKIYAEENSTKMNELFGAVYVARNISPDGKTGTLKSLGIEKSYTISLHNMEDKLETFFNWVMNFSLDKAYSSAEMFLLNAIQIKYFSHLDSPVKGSAQANAVHAEIKSYLNQNAISYTTKNNKHIIKFLQAKSPDYNLFSALPIEVGSSTSWEMFFEFFSIIRNTITHHNMIVTPLAHANINSIAKTLFKRHFNLVDDELGDKILCPVHLKDGSPLFAILLNLLNLFVLNTVKFIFDENDIDFLGLKDVH